LSTTHKILSSILLSSLTPYLEEIIESHQFEFWHNRSTTDQIFCFRQRLKKKWKNM